MPDRPSADQPAGTFIDTNVLLYLASADEAKARVAEQLLADGGTISVQVLNELANVARRKMQLPWGETIAFVEDISALLAVVPLTVVIHAQGLRLCARYGFSVWDAMILASALDSGCTVLLSEDMQNGLVVDGRLEIRNPFL